MKVASSDIDCQADLAAAPFGSLADVAAIVTSALPHGWSVSPIQVGLCFSHNVIRSFEAVIPVLCDRAVFVLFSPGNTVSSSSSSTDPSALKPPTLTPLSSALTDSSRKPPIPTTPPLPSDLTDSSRWIVRRQKMMMTSKDEAAGGGVRLLREWSRDSAESPWNLVAAILNCLQDEMALDVEKRRDDDVDDCGNQRKKSGLSSSSVKKYDKRPKSLSRNSAQQAIREKKLRRKKKRSVELQKNGVHPSKTSSSVSVGTLTGINTTTTTTETITSLTPLSSTPLSSTPMSSTPLLMKTHYIAQPRIIVVSQSSDGMRQISLQTSDSRRHQVGLQEPDSCRGKSNPTLPPLPPLPPLPSFGSSSIDISQLSSTSLSSSNLRIAVDLPPVSANLVVGKLMDGDDDDDEDDDNAIVGPLGQMLPILSPSSLNSSLVKDASMTASSRTLSCDGSSLLNAIAISNAAPNTETERKDDEDSEDDDDDEEDEDDEEEEDNSPGKKGVKRSVQNIPYTVTRNGFQRLFKCDSCDRSFSRKGSLFRHYREKHAPTTPAFNCQYCNYVSCKKTNLDRHIMIHMDAKPFQCAFCPLAFKDYSNKEKHEIRVHNKNNKQVRFQCDLCGKIYKTQLSFNYHTQTHAQGEKPFKCQFCGKGFTDERWFQGHMREHTGEKPYTCDVCGLGFSSKPQLKSHSSIRHSGVPAAQQPRDFPCAECAKAFRTKDKLEYHMRSHSDKTYCTCSVCGKAFKYATSLARHMQYHSESRPHACGFCDKTYKVKNDLTSHVKKAHSSTTPDQQQQAKQLRQQQQMKTESMGLTTATLTTSSTASIIPDGVLLTTGDDDDDELHFISDIEGDNLIAASVEGGLIATSGLLSTSVCQNLVATTGVGGLVSTSIGNELIDSTIGGGLVSNALGGGLVATSACATLVAVPANTGLVAPTGVLVSTTSGLVDDGVDDPGGPTAGQGQVVEVHPSVALVDAKYQPMASLHLNQEQPQYQQLQQPSSSSHSVSQLQLQQQTQMLQQSSLSTTLVQNVSSTSQMQESMMESDDLHLATILSLPARANNDRTQQQQQQQQQQILAHDAMIETTPHVGAEQVVMTEESRDVIRDDVGVLILDSQWNFNRSHGNSKKKY